MCLTIVGCGWVDDEMSLSRCTCVCVSVCVFVICVCCLWWIRYICVHVCVFVHTLLWFMGIMVHGNVWWQGMKGGEGVVHKASAHGLEDTTSSWAPDEFVFSPQVCGCVGVFFSSTPTHLGMSEFVFSPQICHQRHTFVDGVKCMCVYVLCVYTISSVCAAGQRAKGIKKNLSRFITDNCVLCVG